MEKIKDFSTEGAVINGIKNYTPKEALFELQNGAVLIDLRRDAEVAYKAFDVPETIYSSPNELKENFQNLPVDKPLIIADNAGVRSRQITEFLLENNFSKIANLSGGMFEWDRNNLPILINNKERLSGSCLCMLKPMNKVRNKED